jgi:hypothetical protein
VRVAMKTPNSRPMTFLQLAPAYHFDVELSLALVRQQLFHHRRHARESLLQIMHVKMMNVRAAKKTPNSRPIQLAPAYHCQRLGLQFPSMFALQLQPPTFRPLPLHTQWYLKPLAFGILAAASTPRICIPCQSRIRIRRATWRSIELRIENPFMPWKASFDSRNSRLFAEKMSCARWEQRRIILPLLQVIIRLYRCLCHIGDIGNHHHHLISVGINDAHE